MSEIGRGHEPVLVAPLLRLLDLAPGQSVLDGTVGVGGHAIALFPSTSPDGRYIGLDLDASMLALARARLEREFGKDAAVTLIQANYVDCASTLEKLGLAQVDAMLLDLGANSAQIDEPSRGFAFDRDGPLDMRYDQTTKRQAVDLVNGMSERALSDLFWEYGQEAHSRKVAKRICQARHARRITTTRELAGIVESAIESGKSRGRRHAATRVFQALRIAVNQELENLRTFLEQAVAHLRPGGRLAVISFHSLEDGMVKRFVRSWKEQGLMRELTKRPVTADAQECRRNPRSRSAKLRVAQRVEG